MTPIQIDRLLNKINANRRVSAVVTTIDRSLDSVTFQSSDDHARQIVELLAWQGGAKRVRGEGDTLIVMF